MDAGWKIQTLRKKKGLTQQVLADILGVARTTVLSWEKGAFFPEGENLLNLAKALDTSAAYLLGETDTSNYAEHGENAVRRSQAAKDMEKMIKDLSHGNPDIGMLLRTTSENWENLSEKDIKFISDSIAVALGRVTDDLSARIRKESKDGRL